MARQATVVVRAVPRASRMAVMGWVVAEVVQHPAASAMAAAMVSGWWMMAGCLVHEDFRTFLGRRTSPHLRRHTTCCQCTKRLRGMHALQGSRH